MLFEVCMSVFVFSVVVVVFFKYGINYASYDVSYCCFCMKDTQ